MKVSVRIDSELNSPFIGIPLLYYSITNIMSNIRCQYLSPKLTGSFSSYSTFLKNRKFTDKKAVKKELMKLPFLYYHIPGKKKFRRRKIISLYRNMTWGIDLADLTRYSQENRQYKWLLIIIDFFSRKMYTDVLKDKNGISVARALRKILKKQQPKFGFVDQGLLGILIFKVTSSVPCQLIKYLIFFGLNGTFWILRLEGKNKLLT